MQADGGYVQMYYALGLIASIVFYGALFGTMCRYLRTIKKSVNLTYFVMYALILVVVEIKEPFTFKYILPMLFFVIVMLYHKRICKETSDYDTKRKN